ncbi:MAG: putative porin [Myxococcota bacterium]
MLQILARGCAAASVLFILGSGGPAPAAETGTIEEIVSILRSEGLIDEATRQKLLAKHHNEQRRRAAVSAGPLSGLEWTGELRLRHEAFWFDGDATGTPEPDNRYRFRYRARLGFQKQVSERVRVGMRLASGTGSARSTNVSFGEQPDWRPDDIFIDRAWAELRLTEGRVRTRLVAGRVANPFQWSIGMDRLMWDPDIAPEGAYLEARTGLGENAKLWATLGAFIAEEKSVNADPKLFGLQLGGSTRLSDTLEIGGRISGYEWRSLDQDFIRRALDSGNLPSAFDGRARIGELSAYARITANDTWPLLVYGTYERNFTADSALIDGLPTDEEDTAWGAGFELGDAAKIAKLGFAFYRVEANAIVASFADSDFLAGGTNREGFVAYASRKLGPRVELRLTFIDVEEIRSSSPFTESLGGADRRRLQSDVLVSF